MSLNGAEGKDKVGFKMQNSSSEELMMFLVFMASIIMIFLILESNQDTKFQMGFELEGTLNSAIRPITIVEYVTK